MFSKDNPFSDFKKRNMLKATSTIEEASKDAEDEFHTKLDDLVHATFGPSSDEKNPKESSKDADKLHKVLGPTKNLKQGIEAVKKAFKVNDAEAEKMIKSLMDKEEIEEKFNPKQVKQAIGIASDKRYARGNMTGAVDTIEKLAKGLSDHPQVKAVLKRQNEAVENISISKLDSKTIKMLKDLDPDEARLIIQGLPKSLRAKAMKEVGIKEKVDGRTKAYKETAARLMARKEAREKTMNEQDEEVDEACWDGYERVPGTKEFDKGSCQKEDTDIEESLKKDIAKISSKFPEGSKVRCNKSGKTGTVLTVGKDFVKVAVDGGKDVDCKPSELTSLKESSGIEEVVSEQSLEEKRAFIYAAAQAKADGKKSFVFAGKEFKVKLKGGPTVEASKKVEDEEDTKD